MTRADIIQIIFGIHAEGMNNMKDLLRNNCDENIHGCADCEYNDNESICDPSCLLFWVDSMTGEEWEDCIQRFTILYNTYRLGHNRGYLEGEKHQHEKESEEKINE